MSSFQYNKEKITNYQNFVPFLTINIKDSRFKAIDNMIEFGCTGLLPIGPMDMKPSLVVFMYGDVIPRSSGKTTIQEVLSQSMGFCLWT